MNSPIVSIVIPTKNRYQTLVPLVKGILKWSTNDFEILVHDNSDAPTFSDFLSPDELRDNRLNYIHTDAPLSMTENCSRAIEKANGTYVCFIGDDDGVLESVVLVCKWMERQAIDTASFTKASYVWPDLTTGFDGSSASSGQLTLRKYTAKISPIDAKKELKKLLQNGLHHYAFKGPVPYHGLCRRQILMDVFDRTKSCFPGPTPDISGLVVAGIASRKHVFIDMPIVYSGQSARSAGGLGRKGKHEGEIADIKSLPKNSAQVWSKQLPHFWSSITINGESAIKTLEALNANDELNSLNVNRLMASIWIHVPNYRKRTWQHIKDKAKQKKFGINVCNVFWELLRLYSQKALHKIKHIFLKTKPTTITENCNDINDATKILESNIAHLLGIFKT